MLSSVFISGRLGDSISEDIRYVEVDAVIPGPSGKYETFLLPVTCPHCKSAYFYAAKKGSLIILKGRLETRPEFGLLVALEIEEIFSSGKPLERRVDLLE